MAGLKVDFKDALPVADAGGNRVRKYQEIRNADGTVTLNDVTVYDQLGSDFGAGEINATNKAVNESFGSKDILKTKEEVAAVTVPGKVADAMVVKEINNSLNGIEFRIVNGVLQYRYPESGV